MRNPTVTCLVTVLIISLIGPPAIAGKKKDWRAAAKADTIGAYEAFLRKYPDGKFSEDAKQAIQELKTENEKQQQREAQQRIEKEASQKRSEEARMQLSTYRVGKNDRTLFRAVWDFTTTQEFGIVGVNSDGQTIEYVMGSSTIGSPMPRATKPAADIDHSEYFDFTSAGSFQDSVLRYIEKKALGGEHVETKVGPTSGAAPVCSLSFSLKNNLLERSTCSDSPPLKESP